MKSVLSLQNTLRKTLKIELNYFNSPKKRLNNREYISFISCEIKIKLCGPNKTRMTFLQNIVSHLKGVFLVNYIFSSNMRYFGSHKSEDTSI